MTLTENSIYKKERGRGCERTQEINFKSVDLFGSVAYQWISNKKLNINLQIHLTNMPISSISMGSDQGGCRMQILYIIIQDFQ